MRGKSNAGPKFEFTLNADVSDGKMQIEASLEPFTENELPLHVALDLQNSELKADDINLLSYLVPILAGPRSAGMVNFNSRADLQIEFDGRYDPEQHDSLVAFLTALNGHGKLNLRGGTFMPADELTRLFSLLGKREALEIRDLSSQFSFDHGKIETSVLELNSKDRRFRMSGTTTIDGEIDYAIDASDLLRGHRDGDRVLSYLDGEGLEAALTGNLAAPSLSMPDITELLLRASGKAIDKELEQQAQKGLDKLFRKIFKKK
jgi:hypothetical protein